MVAEIVSYDRSDVSPDGEQIFVRGRELPRRLHADPRT